MHLEAATLKGSLKARINAKCRNARLKDHTYRTLCIVYATVFKFSSLAQLPHFLPSNCQHIAHNLPGFYFTHLAIFITNADHLNGVSFGRNMRFFLHKNVWMISRGLPNFCLF